MTTYQTADGMVHYTDVEANLLGGGLLIGRVRVVRLSEALDVDGRGDVRGRIEPLPASESRPAVDLTALAAQRAAVTLDCFSLLLFWDCIVVSAEGDLENRGPSCTDAEPTRPLRCRAGDFLGPTRRLTGASLVTGLGLRAALAKRRL